MKTLRLWFRDARTETIRVPAWLSREDCVAEVKKYLADAWEETDA